MTGPHTIHCLTLDLGPKTLLLPMKMIVEIVWIPADWVDWQASGFPRSGHASWQTEIILGLSFDAKDGSGQDRFLFAILRSSGFCAGINFLALQLQQRPKTMLVSEGQYHYLNATPSDKDWFIPLAPEPLAVPHLPTWRAGLTKLVYSNKNRGS